MTTTSLPNTTDIPSYFDGTFTHLLPLCADGVPGATMETGFGLTRGFPCTCCDDLVLSVYGTGSGMAARLAGNVEGATYRLPSGGTGHGSTVNPPSEKQLNFYARLVAERLPEAERAAALVGPHMTNRKLISAKIERLMSKPKIESATPANTEGRANRYAGECSKCHRTVAAGEGTIAKVGERWITTHTACPETAAPVAPTADVPAGHYAYPSSGRNDLAFVRVDRPTEGRWAGHTFASWIIGGHPETRVARAQLDSVLASIVEFGIDAAAVKYGQEIGRCYRCNRSLTDETSRALGIGPDCRSRHA